MRKIIILLSLVCSLASFSQEKYPVYCEVLTFSSNSLGRCRVLVDMGEYSCGVLVDENKKEIQFGSLIAAANYMVKRGWRIVTSYSMEANIIGRAHSAFCKYFLMEKQVCSETEMYDGLNIWYENKKSRQSYENKKTNDDVYK